VYLFKITCIFIFINGSVFLGYLCITHAGLYRRIICINFIFMPFNFFIIISIS